MGKLSSAATAACLSAAVLLASSTAFASPSGKASVNRPAASANQQMTDLSSSWRGRRNTAIALGAAAGFLGALAVGGGYPYYPYAYYGPAYPTYGYYGPYPYYAPPVVYVRPRKVRCLAFDPYRGVRYWTTCYR